MKREDMEEIGNESPPEFCRRWSFSKESNPDVDPQYDSPKYKGVDLRHVSDKDGFEMVEHLKPRQWRIYYNIVLSGRLGLHCYNLQKGTNYKFEFVTRYDSRFDSLTKPLITLKAMNPVDNAPLTFETLVGVTEGVESLWETCICRVEGSDEAADPEWDNDAINARYKDEMPKWFSNDDEQQQRYYVMKESEWLKKENWWLHLFTEIAFYTKWSLEIRPRDIAECLQLDIRKVVVETRGGEEAAATVESLKAANAIVYISFDCLDDPLTAKISSYRAVVRKTMDGKPGHMRLEVNCWS